MSFQGQAGDFEPGTFKPVDLMPNCIIGLLLLMVGAV
jgi:hypothetical protein